jgi:hypothetical protein
MTYINNKLRPPGLFFLSISLSPCALAHWQAAAAAMPWSHLLHGCSEVHLRRRRKDTRRPPAPSQGHKKALLFPCADRQTQQGHTSNAVLSVARRSPSNLAECPSPPSSQLVRWPPAHLMQSYVQLLSLIYIYATCISCCMWPCRVEASPAIVSAPSKAKEVIWVCKDACLLARITCVTEPTSAVCICSPAVMPC